MEEKKKDFPLNLEYYKQEGNMYFGAPVPELNDIKGKLDGLRWKLDVEPSEDHKAKYINYGRAHVQVPISLFKQKKLLKREIFVYSLLRRYRNGTPNTKHYKRAFIALDKLCPKHKIGKETIVECHRELEKKGYLEVKKYPHYDPRSQRVVESNLYCFPKVDDNWRSIPVKLIDSTSLKNDTKSFLCNIMDLFHIDHEKCLWILRKTNYFICKERNYDRKTVKKHFKLIQQDPELSRIIVIDPQYEIIKWTDGEKQDYNEYFEDSEEEYEDSDEEISKLTYGKIRSDNRYFIKNNLYNSAGESEEKKSDEEWG